MSDKPKKQSSYTGVKDLGQMVNYIKTVDKDLQNLFTYLDRFPRFFTQSAQPTLQRNTFGFWKDQDDSKFYLIANIAGTAKKVELT